MEHIRRSKRVRMSKLDPSGEPDPTFEEPTGRDTLRFARGTEPLVRLNIDEPGPSLAAGDIMNVVAALKVPITDVMLETCLLEATHASSELHRVLARISASMQRLDRIASELGDVAAIMQDRLILCRRSNEMRSLLLEAVERAIPARDRARIFVEAPPAYLALVDAPRLERVIATLLKQALRASPGGSGIVVRLEALENVARVSVIDAGRGISQMAADSMFDPSDDGISMYVCRRIVEAHGGRVGIENHPGAGTRVYFELPVGKVARLHALLVDDDHRQLDALAELLRRAGIAVTVADCGSVALASTHDARLDIAILDVEMPDVSATELVRQLRDRCPNIPVIVVSGHPADSARVIEVLDECHGRFVAKPIEIETLLHEITRCTAPAS